MRQKKQIREFNKNTGQIDYNNDQNISSHRNVQNIVSNSGTYNQVTHRFFQSGYERFQMELRRDGLIINDIIGDGSCMYRSIADQLEQVYPRKSYHYLYVKDQILQHIRGNAGTYAQFVENNDIKRYLKNKELDGVWGGIIELKVAAKIFKVNVYVYSTTDPSWGLKLFEGDEVKTILLSYHGNSHYNSLRKLEIGTNRVQSNQQMWTAPKQSQKEDRKKQFLDDLRRDKLEIVEVVGTGNRLFHAVADQLQQVLGQNIDHKKVRDNIILHMKNNQKKYLSQVEDGDVDKYVKKLKGIEYNGTDVELQAVADHFEVSIKVFCTDEPTHKIESPSRSDKWIFLSYHDNSYYNSLEKITDTPPQQPEEVPSHKNSTAQHPQNTPPSNSISRLIQHFPPFPKPGPLIETLRSAQKYCQQQLQQQPTTENYQLTSKTEVKSTSQFLCQKELEESYNEFKRELAEVWNLEIVPLEMGASNRLIHCIAHQLQQVDPGSNYDYHVVNNKIQQQINSHKNEYYNFKGNKLQGPRENGGIDELRTVRAVFKVDVEVYYPGKRSEKFRFDGNNRGTIYLSCFNGNIYDSLIRITKSSSHQSGVQSTKSKQDTQLQVPQVQKISRFHTKDSSSYVEKNFQEFQTSKERNEFVEKVIIKVGSGFFHCIADQLQILDDKWYIIDAEKVKKDIISYLNNNRARYSPLLGHQFQSHCNNMSLRGFEVADLDLQIISHTFEVNVVLYTRDSRTQIKNAFLYEPRTIYLSYDGTRFKSLIRKENTYDGIESFKKRENTFDQQKQGLRKGSSNSARWQIDDNWFLRYF